MSRIVLPPKALNEIVTTTFDFTSRLAASETISTQVTTATVVSGTDASPASLIISAATASGQVVSQRIGYGVLGVVYELVCKITTSASQTLQLSAYLAVTPNLE